jgi:hypothetical protein
LFCPCRPGLSRVPADNTRREDSLKLLAMTRRDRELQGLLRSRPCTESDRLLWASSGMFADRSFVLLDAEDAEDAEDTEDAVCGRRRWSEHIYSCVAYLRGQVTPPATLRGVGLAQGCRVDDPRQGPQERSRCSTVLSWWWSLPQSLVDFPPKISPGQATHTRRDRSPGFRV